MLVGQTAVRALLSGIAMNHLEMLPETSPNPGGLRFLRMSRQTGTCRTGEKWCLDGCIPLDGVCCTSRGTYCDAGYYCMAVSGCCREGRTCSGVSGTCDPGEVMCNRGCMPSSGVCCPGGGYCEAGYECTTTNTCRRTGSSGGGSSDGGSSGGTTTCGTGRKRCDRDYCIPVGGTCCNRGTGWYCEDGHYCLAGRGCCPDGRTCRPITALTQDPVTFTSTPTTTSTPRAIQTSDADEDGGNSGSPEPTDGFGGLDDLIDGTSTTTTSTPTETPLIPPAITNPIAGNGNGNGGGSGGVRSLEVSMAGCFLGVIVGAAGLFL